MKETLVALMINVTFNILHYPVLVLAVIIHVLVDGPAWVRAHMEVKTGRISDE